MKIDRKFLQEHGAKSKARGSTTAFLKHFTFTVVDRALRRHFGDNYSIRCLQGSVGAQLVLAEAGIVSRLWMGAASYALGFAGEPKPPRVFRFGGFWGEDHHVWCTTEFYEFVDLTISQLHRHPRTSRRDTLPVPPLWWNVNPGMVPTVKYLPQGPVGGLQLEPEEDREHQAFVKCVLPCLEEVMSGIDSRAIDFGTILEGTGTLDRLTEIGDPWVTQAKVYYDLRVPHADWVEERERALMAVAGEHARRRSEEGRGAL